MKSFGNYNNSRGSKNKLDQNIRDNIKVDVDSDNSNIYNRGYFSKSKKKYQAMADKINKDSKHPSKTGVIPTLYNLRQANPDAKQPMNYELFKGISSDSCNSKDSCASITINMNDPLCFIKKADNLIDNRKHERRFVKKVPDNNNFLSQFEQMSFDNPSDPVSSNAISQNNASDGTIKRMETERTIALHEGFSNFGEGADMRYGVTNDMTHKNMEPNFRSNQSNPLFRKHQGDTFQQQMELFTGMKRDDWNHKKEQTPLFNPVTGITNPYGTPVMTDFYQSRYLPSKERRNEKPFQPVRVGPGLGLGSKGVNMAPKGGGDSYRVLPRTTDQIRPLTRPKLSYEGVIVEGQKGVRQPIQGQVDYTKADNKKVVTNIPTAPTYGYVHVPKVTGQFTTSASNNRGILRTLVGPARAQIDKNTSIGLRGQFKQSFKETFLQAPPSNVHLVEGLRGRSKSVDETFVPNLTQRGQTNPYVGPVGSSQTDKAYAFDVITNIPNATNRDTTQRVDRYGQAITGNMYQAKAFDPNDTPDTTLRDTTQRTDRAGQALTGNMYQTKAIDWNDIPDTTTRETTQLTDRAGQAITGNMYQTKAFDPNDTPDTTMRETTQKTDRSGKAITGNMFQTKAFDPNDVPDTTLRDTTQKTDRSGKAITGNMFQTKTFDPNDVPDTTLRDTTQKTDRSGKAITGNMFQTKVFDPNDTPNTTMRETTQKTDRSGKAITGNMFQTKSFDPNDVPDTTIRDTTQKTDRSGKAITGNMYQVRAFDPNDTPDTTLRDVTQNTDRAGQAVTGNSYKSKAIDWNDVPDMPIKAIQNYDDVGPTRAVNDKSYVVNYELTTPNVTNREITGATNRINPARSEVGYDRSRRDIYNGRVNVGRDQVGQTGRTPTLISWDKGYNSRVNVSYCDKEKLNVQNRIGNPAAMHQSSDHLPFSFEKNKNEKFYVNTRINSYPSENLEGNPYVSNIITKSVIKY